MDMLIVALQDDVDNLYAIWNTVTDRFLGVNLGKHEAVGIIMDYKGCDYETALSRAENPEPFFHIADNIVEGTDVSTMRTREEVEKWEEFHNSDIRYDEMKQGNELYRQLNKLINGR